MATSNQDTNIKDVPAPASATSTNIGHILGLNAAKTQDVLIPLSMLRTVIAAELKTALAAITSGSPDVPVLDGNNLKYMTLANFAKVAGEQSMTLGPGATVSLEPSAIYAFGAVGPYGGIVKTGSSSGQYIIFAGSDNRVSLTDSTAYLYINTSNCTATNNTSTQNFYYRRIC